MKHSPAKLIISPELLVRFVLAFSALSLVSQLRGQVGNDNPTGPSGIFNGNITTGCSYDPYTGNATRTVTDIVVSGAVGEYPLAFSRTYNSRNAQGFWFGGAGGWHHNYEWSLEDSAARTTPNVQPTSYTVDFPDGRSERFVSSSSDPGYFRPLAGIGDRFQPLNASLLAYLVLPDGGKVEFKATQQANADQCCPQDGCGTCTYYYYSYVAQAIIDPYGLKTTLTYSNGILQTITEPAGRTLTLNYGQGFVISMVTSSDGRAVNYYYIQSTFPPIPWLITALDHVIYYSTSAWTAYYTYQGPNAGYPYAPPLLLTADDPMYPGPMKRIAYTYRTTPNQDTTAPVYGQINSENYYDGTSIGAAVSTLTVTGLTTRMETRGDGKTRTFTYQSGGYLSSCTDFKGLSASQTYDANMYINSVTDRNGHTTNFTSDAHTGLVTQIQYPLTQGDTPGQWQRPTVNYTYTSDYYLYSSQDEAGKTTTFTRDPNTHRITRIDYPDNGYETFTFYNTLGQFWNHRLKTGGTEAFTYDWRGLKQTYRNPSNPTGNPTAQYQYDAFDRVSGVTDALGSTSGDVNHTTSFAYNARGQLTTTTHPTDSIDNQRHTIINGYNPDGTLASTTNELSHVSQFTYDQYKRLRTAKTPDRFTGDTTPHTTSVFYDANGTADDYTHTDANPTYITLPGGERSQTVYDENYRKTSVTTAFGTTDAATTSFGYDNVGNVTSVKSPKEQPGQPYANKSTITAYDERNRVMSVTDARAGATSYTYDFAGRKASITRPNGQVTSYELYDAMNRLLQQRVKQTPDPDAVTKFTYDSTGSDLFYTMQDPRLVAVASPEKYTFNFDQMGRKTSTVYPPAVNGGASTSESFTYDAAGRLYKFTNRNAKVQTFTYDRLNRPTNVAWNDSGLTPTVTFTYDVAMRVKTINNANATISRVYFNDNLLNTETTTYPGADNTARTVTYTYDADARRATLQYPNNAYSFTYNYSNRSQLWKISNTSGGAVLVTNLYDLDGNLATRTPDNSTSSTYTYDVLDRVINISHALVTGNRTLDYAYDSVSNRKWTKRDGAKGDVFGYDLNDQSTSMLPDILNPDTTAPGPQTINYDANGNRTSFAAYAPTATYVPNNLSQYASRNSINAVYDTKGNMTTGFDGSTYAYDAQNRLLSAAKGSVSYTFKYDALNRQISRTVSGATTYNVYDGWDLIAEYAAHATLPSTAYLAGAGGLVKNLTTNRYYYQDASGSTSHLASSTGALLEWYRYDLQGTPVFYKLDNSQITASAYGVHHLFTGQQWYSQVGLYDLRNRFYSPDIGRFLQTDPIDFKGDATNLYRYCGNNPLKYSDSTGEFAYIYFDPETKYYHVDIPITYTGPYSAQLGPQINSMINQTSGRYSNVIINARPPQPGEITNFVDVHAVQDENGGWHAIPGSYRNDTVALSVNPDEDPNVLGQDAVGIGQYLMGTNLPPGPEAFGEIWPQSKLDLQKFYDYIHTAWIDAPSAPPPSENDQAKLRGLWRLQMMYNRYWGYLPTTNTTNGFGGIAGLKFGGGSPWDLRNQQGGISWTPGGVTIGEGFHGFEPGECFVAGTPVLMADGSEKPIESIQVGEEVLAWNEETKKVFSTKVVTALHHNEKMETLFDIELDDGRTLTANNNHPMYVVEDGDFKFTDELAGRFAKGEPITFQDNNNQPVRIASLRMRRQTCKMYNLHVEGQGEKGHTYYANGILVHNSAAGLREK